MKLTPEQEQQARALFETGKGRGLLDRHSDGSYIGMTERAEWRGFLRGLAAGMAQQRETQWTRMDDGVPEPDTDCIVLVPGLVKERGPYCVVDRWEMQHDSPVGWSSATIEIGYGFSDGAADGAIAWMPLPQVPEAIRAQGDD